MNENVISRPQNTKPLLIVNGIRAEDEDILSLMRSKGIEFLFIPCWKTMVKIPLELTDEAVKYAQGLSSIDDTFFWKIIPSYLPDVKAQKCRLLVIYSPTRDLAYRRGGYFLHKLNLKKYKRIEKGYYWVKLYPSNLHHVDPDTGNIVVDKEYEELLHKIMSKLSKVTRQKTTPSETLHHDK